MNLERFINQTEMVSFAGFVRTIGWITVLWAFTAVACILLLRENDLGFQLAVTVLSGLGFASAIGAYNTKTVRETAKEYAPVAEAKARGKNGHAAPAAVPTAPTAGAAVNVEQAETVTVVDQPTSRSAGMDNSRHDDERG